jgi:hypothetical protein
MRRILPSPKDFLIPSIPRLVVGAILSAHCFDEREVEPTGGADHPEPVHRDPRIDAVRFEWIEAYQVWHANLG